MTTNVKKEEIVKVETKKLEDVKGGFTLSSFNLRGLTNISSRFQSVNGRWGSVAL